MFKPLILALPALAVLAVTGCDRGDTPAAKATAASSSEPADTRPEPAKSATPTDCAPGPRLDPIPEVQGADLTKLGTAFASAYRQACGEGLLAAAPLIPADVPHPGTLTLLNAPDANVATIYRAGDNGSGDMMLEYPFRGSDGSHSLPTVDDLHEAIYCAVHGASEQEQDDSGRCLAD